MDPEKVDHFVTDGVANTLKLGGACGGSCREKKGCCLEPIDIKKYKTLKLGSRPFSLLDRWRANYKPVRFSSIAEDNASSAFRRPDFTFEDSSPL